MIWKSLLHKRRESRGQMILVMMSTIVSMVFVFFLLIIYHNIEGFFVAQRRGEIISTRFDMVKRNTDDISVFDRKPFEEDILEELRDDERIDRLYAMYRVRIPAVVAIDHRDIRNGSNRLLRRLFADIAINVSMDMFLYAIEDVYREQDVEEMFETDGVVPLALSELLLDIYNTQVAGTTAEFPPLNSAMITQIPLRIRFGDAIVIGQPIEPLADATTRFEARIVMFDNALPMLGATIPESIARAMLERFDEEDVSIQLHGVLGFVNQVEDIDAIKEQYEADYYIRSDDDVVANVRRQLTGVRVFVMSMAAVSGLLVLFFIVYVLQQTRQQNKKMFFVYRIHGARRRTLWSIVASEAGVYLCIGGVVLLLAWLVMWPLLPWRGGQVFMARGFSFVPTVVDWYYTIVVRLLHIIVISLVTMLMQYDLIMRSYEYDSSAGGSG